MAFNPERILLLLRAYSDRKATPEEQRELMDWLADHEDDGSFKDHIHQLLQDFPAEQKLEGVDWENIYSAILAKRNTDAGAAIYPELTYSSGSSNEAPVHRVHFLKTSWFRYAAAVVLIAGGAAIWYTQSAKSDKSGESAVQTSVVDIAPGSSKAVLTLADGSTIVLDEARNGNLVQQGNAQVVKLANGQLAYKVGDRLSREMIYNTMTTPRGGQYRLTLPDGSNVWLNAASSIKYPTAFVGTERSVEVTGEVYMEITQNPKQPFIVKANGTEVRVLGTSFNINAYSDEDAIRTTLVEGSVRVNNTILKPSQEAIVGTANIIKVQSADIQQTLAWKNGIFNFNNVDIKGMMRQLSRWYDVDVVYEGRIPERVFEGKMQRNIPLSSALKILELNKINFRVEGRKIIVRP